MNNIQAEKVLRSEMDKIKRYGVDITMSKFKDKDLESEKVMAFYLTAVRRFLKSYDFQRLEQTIFNHQWQASLTTLRRLESTAGELGAIFLFKPMYTIRRGILNKKQRTAAQGMSVIINKKAQILRLLGENQ